MPDDTKSRIAQLENELYGKEYKPYEVEETLAHKEAAVPEAWDVATEEEEHRHAEECAAKRHRMLKKITYFSVGFFVFALAVAGFIWLRGSNIISSQNVDITAAAPVAVAGGEPFESTFTITNKNKVAIEQATLYVEYPTGFYDVTNKKELPRISKDLGTIAAGQVVTEAMSALLYGQEGAQKNVTLTLEYKLAGSNATLKKEKSYQVRISSSPVSLSVVTPPKASSGQEVEFTVEVGSNSTTPIAGLLLNASYPAGFSFKSALPAPTYGNNVWSFDTLATQDKRTIKVRGIVEGQENEERVVQFSVGTQDTRDERQIGVVYNVAEGSVALMKPFLGLDVAVDGDSSAVHAASLGRGVRVTVSWKSNMSTAVSDAVIEVALKGAALNRYSVYADTGGFYRSIDNTVIWDKTVNSALGNIEPGDRGAVSLAFSPIAISGTVGQSLANPEIGIEVRVRAKGMIDSTTQEVATMASRTVRFNTDLALTAQSLYSVGAFKNTGPLPPKADKPTTYTVRWEVRSGTNSASNATVKTTLPLYVNWTGNVSPAGEDITWDESKREVTWNAGRIPAGGSREVAFQISFTPSLGQSGQSPYLTGNNLLSATDDFTGAPLSDRRIPLTTNLYSDPKFSQNQAVVIQ